MLLDNVVPKNLDRLMGLDDSKYKLTLLYKTTNAMYSFLSSNLRDLAPGNEIPEGYLIKSGKKISISTFSDISFEYRDIKDGKYLLMDAKNHADIKNQYILPFNFHKDLSSEVVDQSLIKILQSYGEYENKETIEIFESIGSDGFIEAFKNYDFKENEQKKAEIGGSLSDSIDGLFKEESSPSVPLQKGKIKFKDRKRKVLYQGKGFIKSLMGHISFFI